MLTVEITTLRPIGNSASETSDRTVHDSLVQQRLLRSLSLSHTLRLSERHCIRPTTHRLGNRTLWRIVRNDTRTIFSEHNVDRIDEQIELYSALFKSNARRSRRRI